MIRLYTEGKVYRYISSTYFILHCIHFVMIMTGIFLPYVNGATFLEIFSHVGGVVLIGLASLAVGCWLSWRTIRRPKSCIATLCLDSLWHSIHYIMFFSLAPTAILMSLFGMEVSMDFGNGVYILLQCMRIIQIDIIFLIYYIILAILECRAKAKSDHETTEVT